VCGVLCKHLCDFCHLGIHWVRQFLSFLQAQFPYTHDDAERLDPLPPGLLLLSLYRNS
jgi:hypothetical protein